MWGSAQGLPEGTWLCGWVPAGSCDLSIILQAPEGESQPMTEVDLFVSTQRIKVLTADTQVSRNSSNHVALWLLQHSHLVLGSQLCSHTSRVLPSDGLWMRTHVWEGTCHFIAILCHVLASLCGCTRLPMQPAPSGTAGNPN